MRLSRVILWMMAGTIVLTIGSLVLTYFFALIPADPLALIGCGMLALTYLVVALSCASAKENGRAPRLMLSGISIGALALAGWLVLIAVQPRWETLLACEKVLIWPTLWAGLMMQVGLLLLPAAHAAWWASLRRITIGLLGVLVIQICLSLTFYPSGSWERVRDYEDVVSRLGGIMAFLAGGCVVVTFLCAWLARLSGPARAIELRPYTVVCPRCGDEQQMQTGTNGCRNCRLRIRVELT